jgi:hypothetical protein
MKLGKLNLTGIDTELAKGYLPIVGDGKIVFQITDGNLDSDHSDIASITNWDKYGLLAGRTFAEVRNEIIALASDFNSLSESEKQIACKYFAVSKANRDTIYTDAEQTQHAIDLQMKLFETKFKDEAIINANYYVNSVNAPELIVGSKNYFIMNSPTKTWKFTIDDNGELTTTQI